ncbi:MAG: ParA family protein [Alkalilacustris sp.]
MKVVACYSNKGGVGKTATAVNLAHALARDGRRVLLCDLDPQGAAGFYLRIKPSRTLAPAQVFKDADRFTGAIRGSDFDMLDVLPSNLGFRDFDILLVRMKNSRSRLKKALKAAGQEYDVVVLDCLPNLSTLGENIFRAADVIVVPVIPTTLSERTFEQLLEIFDDQGHDRKKVRGFFSMAQGTKTLHAQTMTRMRRSHPKRLLDVVVPFASDVEKMGLHRAPVASFAPASAAATAYGRLAQAVAARL